MKKLSSQAQTVLAIVAVVVIGAAFWMILLAPKREKASELSEQAAALKTQVQTEEQRVESALAAKREFAPDYKQLVLLGKAVPADAATPSLLVQLNGLGNRANTSFQSIALGTGGGTATETTEASTTLPPLGSTVGPAGFLAMPYSLETEGGFFDVAGFIRDLDGLVETKGGEVEAKGRLITIDAFDLIPVGVGGEGGSGAPGTLKANFAVSTYVTPPGQGITAGATAAGPEATPSLP